MSAEAGSKACRGEETHLLGADVVDPLARRLCEHERSISEHEGLEVGEEEDAPSLATMYSNLLRKNWLLGGEACSSSAHRGLEVCSMRASTHRRMTMTMIETNDVDPMVIMSCEREKSRGTSVSTFPLPTSPSPRSGPARQGRARR